MVDRSILIKTIECAPLISYPGLDGARGVISVYDTGSIQLNAQSGPLHYSQSLTVSEIREVIAALSDAVECVESLHDSETPAGVEAQAS